MSTSDLPRPAADLAETSLAWLDVSRDQGTGLYRTPGENKCRIRESAWLAQGLLLRARGSDVHDAHRLLEAVVDAQLDAPRTPWHGTFRRFVGEPTPEPGARVWIDYDPNWRQFVGCALSLILAMHGDVLDADLARRMTAAIDHARAGEPADRVSARYTNIALMKAWLDVEAGDPNGIELARAVVRRFDGYGAFDEYGSPTYYGVDLYALALWSGFSRSETLRSEGTRLARTLWNEVAESYHAGLKNLAGPYTRAYGMDMNAYVSLLGLWIWAVAGADAAAVPAATRHPGSALRHAHDFAMAPSIAALAARTPELVDAKDRARLERFEGERSSRRVVAPSRVVTNWLGADAMIGADDHGTDWHDFEQYHAATIHWSALPARDATGACWLRVRHDGPVTARATARRLSLALSCPADRVGRGSRFEISAGTAELSWRDPRCAELRGTPLTFQGDLEGLTWVPGGAIATTPGAMRTLSLPGDRPRELEVDLAETS